VAPKNVKIERKKMVTFLFFKLKIKWQQVKNWLLKSEINPQIN
jgi:hypothetical protein